MPLLPTLISHSNSCLGCCPLHEVFPKGSAGVSCWMRNNNKIKPFLSKMNFSSVCCVRTHVCGWGGGTITHALFLKAICKCLVEGGRFFTRAFHHPTRQLMQCIYLSWFDCHLQRQSHSSKFLKCQCNSRTFSTDWIHGRPKVLWHQTSRHCVLWDADSEIPCAMPGEKLAQEWDLQKLVSLTYAGYKKGESRGGLLGLQPSFCSRKTCWTAPFYSFLESGTYCWEVSSGGASGCSLWAPTFVWQRLWIFFSS